MSPYKELIYTFAQRRRRLSRISEELMWAGDYRINTHDELLDIAKAISDNNKTDEELLGRFIF